jgi:hypothetical protein
MSKALSLVLAGVVAAILFPASAVQADPRNLNQLLQGDYAFSGEGSCLVSLGPLGPPEPTPNPPGGFNSNFTPFGPPARFPFVISFSVHGVRTFNGDGTGTVVTRTVTITHPRAIPGDPPFFDRGGASSSDSESDFTYEVFPDRTFTALGLVAPGTILTGTRAGQTFTVGPLPLRGEISQDRKTLATTSDAPVVETITFSDGDVEKRICHRSRINLKLKTSNGSD